MKQAYTEAYFKASADYVLEKAGFAPEIGVILGSGLSPLGEAVENAIEIPYADIPNYLVSTVQGHAGKLILGTVAGKKVVCMSGRFHTYEGYDPEELTAPIRLFKLLGCKAAVVTNAAGGVNTDYKPGDIMIISDHIKLMGDSPMRGRNVDEFGPRFFDVSKMYTPELREIARRLGKDSGLTIHEGCYFFMTGPQFETPAEIRAIRILGGDAVGMSTVTEALTAAHCGLPFLGLSVITNMAAGILDQPLGHTEVIETANAIRDRLTAYVKAIIAEI
ncbi:MAG: purine-nucleoside phosphorylase [Clostridia bacterium]|nr:purine-nucleoside phosphorylase [Clostridia bacterium]